VKPFRIFIFFLAILLSLLLVSLLFPRQGINMGGDLRLSFPSISDLNHKDTASALIDVEQLLAESGVTEDPESDPGTDLYSGTVATPEPSLPKPSLPKPSDPRVVPANVDSLQRSVYRIRFAGGGATQLRPFFRNLEQLYEGDNQHTRILHFGDSQIENDRMTSLIRYRIQRHFGGTGSGLVQAIPLYSGSLSYRQEETGDWLRYTYFGNRDTTLAHKSYGIMGAFASVPIPDGDLWPSLTYRFNTSRRSGRVQRIRVFLHSYVDGASLVFQANGENSDTVRGLPDGFSVPGFTHSEEIDELKIFFDLPEGGRIYGISFESLEGLQVDNIAMRGGSGLIFSSMTRSTQQSMLDELSPGLILLQYGGNVVPYMSPGYYRRAFKRQLKFFSELCPGIPIIVIGPSDMSVRENGHFNTYPNLEGIRNALRDATLESGFGFWDLYEAMGGKNSMASFVHSDPPLASTDYVHFTNLGVNLVAEMFYNALMLEYRVYESQNSDR
jgi:lysophospholipase L1-like esterase